MGRDGTQARIWYQSFTDPNVDAPYFRRLSPCTLGRKAGLVTINPIFIPYHDDQIARHGLGERVVAVRAVKAQVADYNRAFEDEETYQRMRDDFVEQVRPMLDLGVDVIIPAGGYPMLLFGREDGFSIDGATVLNGIPVTMAAAETAVRLQRLNGTGTSRSAAYALPVPEAAAEYKRFFG